MKIFWGCFKRCQNISVALLLASEAAVCCAGGQMPYDGLLNTFVLKPENEISLSCKINLTVEKEW